ncbi:MAG: right-handed parallel beta-helix repeat-containing protein [Candidatus Parabeggiatoa sp.]|nr:right-handed parallel beta-helix repeat-containing protein [Candidatus Parabeggiatoa sp.]
MFILRGVMEKMGLRSKSEQPDSTPDFPPNTLKLEPAAPSPHFEWALFERMRFAAQIETQWQQERRNSFFMPQTASEVAMRIIPPSDFTTNRLVTEIKTLPENGGEVHLPAGRLELTETLKLRSGVRLVGVLGHTELVFKNVDYGFIIQGDSAAVSRVRVENIKIRHEGIHQFGAAILATKATDLLFSNVEIFSPRAVGFLFSDGVHRAQLERCAVYDAGLVGFMMVRDVRNTVLHACIAERCQQSGVFLTDLKLPPNLEPLDFIAQIHHTAEIIGNFGPFLPDDPSPYRNTIIDCSFRRNRKMGITTDGVGYLRVVNCIIAENDCEGITIDNGSWNCQIQNCHIYNNGWRGLQQDVELNQDFVEKMGLMKDGSSKAKLPGISLDNAAYTRIENNCIEGNWGDGVKFVRSVYGCTVARNIIANNNQGENDEFHFFGVLIGVAQRQHPDQSDFPSCYNRIVENDILGAHHAGVHLLPNTTGNQIQNNRIIDPVFAAVEDHTTTGNVIQNNG